jgi:hypothetical protein
VTDANSLDFTTNASFSVVHNPANIGEASGRIFAKTPILYQITGTAQLTFNTIQSSANVMTYGSQNINSLTFNSSANETKFYKNGTAFGTGAASALSANTSNMYILNQADGTRQYDGKISELILFGTTLTDSQRSKLEKNQGKYFGLSVA